MNAMTKRALVGAIAAAAIMPAGAQANPTASVSAVVKATARADANLGRAQQLADGTVASSQKRAQELLRRSRAQLAKAAATTRTLVEQASRTGNTGPAVRATAHLTASLDRDAAGQVKISATAEGALESAAMKALAADARMELEASADLAKLADETEDQATVIEVLAKQIVGQASDVATDLRAAASGELSATAQKSADLAVAIDTKANATYADILANLKDTVDGTLKPAIEQAVDAIRAQAGQVKGDIEGSLAAGHSVFTDELTLAGLAAETSVQIAATFGDGTATATVESKGSLQLPGLFR